jgi:hypothetical protein
MQFEWFDFWVFLFYFISLSAMSFLLIRENYRSAKVKSSLDQALVDKFILYGKLQKIEERGGVSESEDFINYLSSSRESAYEYIGEVQEKINNFIVAWNNHTTLMPPDGSSEKKLYEAYSDLIAMLPGDTRND